jgi:hypothetical protein
MNSTKLFSKFTDAIQWNSFFYVIYKICYVTLSFTLYYRLSPSLFSAWALGNSLVFLILLWLDCGFRKSVPRYCPEFAKNKIIHKNFIYLILTVQGVVLLAALPILWFVFPYFITYKVLISYTLAMFTINGISELLRIIYHAHFWQKQFNILHTVCVLAEMALNFFFIAWYAPTVTLIKYLFLSKILSGGAIIAGSITMLPSLLKDTTYPGAMRINTKVQTRAFIEHSIVMWATTFIKSLSERNFLFPFLTQSIGAPSANLFKVAHDGALFFQRISIRILGTSDTALLSHVQVYNDTTQLYKKAFTRLLKTVAGLCIPLLYIGVLVFLKRHQSIDQNILSIFFVVAIGYMLEVFLSPYERILEVKRRYLLLWYSYTPYAIGLTYLLVFTQQNFSLFWFVVSMHTFRLSGSLLMTYFAQKYYPMPFPKRFIFMIILVSAFVSSIIWWFI